MKFLDHIEKHLVRAVVLGVVALVAVQAMLTHDPLRFYLSLGERLEGQEMEYPVGGIGEAETLRPQLGTDPEEVASPWAQLTISLQDYSTLARARVLINDKEVAAFTEKEVKLRVMAGDVVEIDSTYYSFPVEYKITAVSPNLASPALDQSYTGDQGLVMIGKIVVK